MLSLVPVVHESQRILTTAQLAESYGTDAKHINDNFANNKDRYTLGKHYFALEGEGLKSFKEAYPILSGNLKFAPTAYLWTEKGAWLHAKSLNTDQAWDAYESLVDEYYRLNEVVKKVVKSVSWERIAVGEIRFAKEFAKAAGIRTERALAVAIARVEHQSGFSLEDYRHLLPAVDQEKAEILTPSQIAEQLQIKPNQVNLLLEEIGLQYGIREVGKREGKERLIKGNPWHLTDKGKEYGIMQDSAKQTRHSKWEGFQILWSPKVIPLLQDSITKKT